MTIKFKLAVKKFIEEDGLKIIRNSKNAKEAILFQYYYIQV